MEDSQKRTTRNYVSMENRREELVFCVPLTLTSNTNSGSFIEDLFNSKSFTAEVQKSVEEFSS